MKTSKEKDPLLSVADSRKYLLKKGLDWGEVWIRRQMGKGRIVSEKVLSSVGIRKSELDRILKDNDC